MTTTTTTTTATTTAVTITISTGLARSNGTGAIRAAVAGLNTTQLFLPLDVDGDGVVTDTDKDVMGLNTTQLFLSLDYDGSGEVTYVDVARYCMARGCDTGDVATALHVPRSGGANREAFVTGLDASTIASAGQDTMAAIVVAADAEENSAPSGTAAACPGVAGEFLPCASGKSCYKAKVQCDGDADCADGSDEGADACSGYAGAAAGDAGNHDAAATPVAATETPAPGDTTDEGAVTIVAVCAAALFVVLAAAAAWRFGCKGGTGASEGDDDGDDQVQGFSMNFANPTFAASQARPPAEDGELYEDTDTLGGGQAPAYEEAGPGTAVAVAEHDYALAAGTADYALATGDSSRQGAVANATYVDTTQDALAQARAPTSPTASQPLYSADAIATAPQPEDQEAYDLGHAETGDQTYDLGNSDAPQGATKSVTRYDYDTDDLSEEEI